jgi:hypothetical protein
MAQHGYLREYDEGWDRGDRDWREASERNRRFMFQERGARDFRPSSDEYYLSWRDKQLEALDRDYVDYRREREQQFHSDFDAWLRQRHGNQGPLRTGMTQTGLSNDPTGELQLTEDEVVTSPTEPDPMATATLGTSTSRGR